MTTGSWVGPVIRKEVRVLLPVWAATMTIALVLLIPGGTRDALDLPRFAWQTFFVIVPLSFVMTPIVLGALSTGHDFAHRTWSMTLVLPVARWKLFSAKAVVLVAMIASVAIMSLTAYFYEFMELEPGRVALLSRNTLRHPTILTPLVGGLVLAPWFALLTRSVVAGAGLAVAVPTALYALSVLGVVSLVGRPDESAPLLTGIGVIGVWQIAMLLVALIGAWQLYRRFVGAEATEPSTRDIASWLAFPRSAPLASSGERRSRVAELAKKELRVQIPTAAVVGSFAAIWIAIAWTPGISPSIFQALVVLIAAVAALLAGSNASAEERQFGTIATQMLLPMAATQQWVIKVFVIAAVVAVCGLGLPMTLAAFSSADIQAEVWSQYGAHKRWPFVAAIGGLTTVAVYVSSLSRGGMRAFIAACAVALAVMVLSQQTAMEIEVAMLRLFGIYSRARNGFVYPSGLRSLYVAFTLLAVWALCLMALRFAYQNHRYLDRSVRRIVTQVAWMYGAYVGMMALIVYLTRIR
jgi:hypothetical protein